MLSMRLSQPLVQLARLQQDLAEVRAAVGEVATVMNAPPEQDRAGVGLRLPIEGEITFEDVRFRYAADAPYALDGVSFRIGQGRIFGIMGRSGSGKTTVTRLLQRLNTDYEGMIKIDGMDLREIDLMHLVDAHLRPTVSIDSKSIESYYNQELLPQLRESGAQEVPLAQVTPQIKELLTQQRVNELLVAWLQSLRSGSEIRLDAESQRAGGDLR